MTPHEFIRKWKPVALTERQTAQEHFIDLCRLANHPTPVEEDPSGERYCFEKGALKSAGTPGFADVWKQGYFAFEYKKKKKSLGEALKQLSQYAWNLENPPLNVVCDTNVIRIVTAWTNTLSKTFDLTLDDLADPEKFAILRAVFHDPEKLRGHMTREMLTKEAADKFLGLAERLQSRGHPPEAVAHFIMQLVFCFFAEDVKLLPEGFFRKALKQLNIGNRHEHAKAMLDDMFSAMATKGGRVGNEFIAYFNGGLFDGQAALPLDEGDLGLLVAVGSMQWAEIDPSIFGTLFERFLDPAKRAQIGAHYTDAKKILQIVDPVVMRPLEAEWAEVKERIEKLVVTAREKADSATITIARDDDTTFGILHSRFHEAWSLRLGTWLGVGNDPRYTPTTTFETFPFPESLSPNIPAAAYAADPRAIRIATAAKKLDDLRKAWLNPPDLINIEPEVVPGYPDRVLPKDAVAAKKLKERTLTNLYNQRPQWLADAHETLDCAVASAYGWTEDISTEEALEKLLALNLARAAEKG
jgi:restriction-modification enzyme MmeI-like protein